MIGPDQEKWRKIQQENIGPLDYMRNSDLMSFLFGDGLWVVLGEFMKFVGYFTTPYTLYLIGKHLSITMDLLCVNPFESSLRRAKRMREKMIWPDDDSSEDEEEEVEGEACNTNIHHQQMTTTTTFRKYPAGGEDVPPEYYEACLV